MIQKATRPITATVIDLGNVTSHHSFDISEHKASLPQIQQVWLSTRFGLGADRARLVAGLAFGSEAGR